MALTALNLLSARKVETAQPRPKVYQLRDGGSLFLRVCGYAGRYLLLIEGRLGTQLF